MLVIPVDGEPAMIVPKLERPDAENAAGASLGLVDWTDGSDPYEATANLLADDRPLCRVGLGLGDAPARSAGPAAAVVLCLDDQ